MNEIKQKNNWFRPLQVTLSFLVGTVIILIGISYAGTNVWPNLGAGAVDLTRGVLGDRFVSEVENLVLSSEDKLKQFQL